MIAIGAGDGQIRVWKMASTKATFDVNVIWQKLNSAKVTALAWHPDKDNLLAFGTDEGRVGTVDAFAQRSIPNFYDSKHKGTVYSLCWGPSVSASDQGGGDNINDLTSSRKVCQRFLTLIISYYNLPTHIVHIYNFMRFFRFCTAAEMESSTCMGMASKNLVAPEESTLKT